MDAERAAHFVKELRILEKDILDLNKRIESIEQCDCLLNEELEKCDFNKGENGGIRVQSRPPFWIDKPLLSAQIYSGFFHSRNLLFSSLFSGFQYSIQKQFILYQFSVES